MSYYPFLRDFSEFPEVSFLYREAAKVLSFANLAAQAALKIVG